MDLKEIAQLRLYHQQLERPVFKTPKELLTYMGALQAQDFNMSKWAAGIRLDASMEKDIEKSLNKGEILRTHVLRPTWHLVSSDNIYWMLELTSPHIQSSMKSRHKELGISEAILTKCYRILEKGLEGGKSLTRKELMLLLEKAKIDTGEQRSAHIMLCAELEGLVCSGPVRAKEQTYGLLEERVPKKKQLDREEALGELARTYFLSHGPATVQDFSWWSGLSLTDAKRATEIAKSELTSFTLEQEVYWHSQSFKAPKNHAPSVHLIPAYDEYIISYKNRDASLGKSHKALTITNNGIFKPVVLIDGLVTGIWSRTVKKDQAVIEVTYFRKPDKLTKNNIELASAKLGSFWERKTIVKHLQ